MQMSFHWNVLCNQRSVGVTNGMLVIGFYYEYKGYWYEMHVTLFNSLAQMLTKSIFVHGMLTYMFTFKLLW